MADTSDPCSASIFTQTISGNLLLCRQQASLASAEQDQIQAVADNASAYYGSGSPAAQATQTAADIQKQYATSDTTSITNDIAKSSLFHPFSNPDCDGADLTIVGLGCIKKWEIFAIVAAVVLFLLGPYLLPYVAPRR